MAFSAFDLDCTLLKKNSSFEFCKFLYKKKVFSVFFILQSVFYYTWYTYFGLTLERLHQKVFKKLLQGMSLQELSEHVSSFLDAHLEDLLYTPVFERLRSAQHRGDFTMILSNSPNFIVSAIALRLQVDDWKCSEYKVDHNHRFCQITSILHGEDKAKWVDLVKKKLKITAKEITVYSDSFYDLPFLSAGGNPVVVNPDSKLKKFSKKFGWEQL